MEITSNSLLKYIALSKTSHLFNKRNNLIEKLYN